jgi:hypothetical protein
MARKASKVIAENVAENMKLPVTYKEFAKNPIVAMLFLTISSTSYLYLASEKKDAAQDDKISILHEMVRRSDSSNAASTARLEMAVDLKALKKFK